MIFIRKTLMKLININDNKPTHLSNYLSNKKNIKF